MSEFDKEDKSNFYHHPHMTLINQKALKEEFRQKKFRIGVFQLRNLTNQKILIGSNVNLEAYWNRMRSELKLGAFRNAELQQAWSELGEAGFAFEILAEIQQDLLQPRNYAREAKELEKLYVDELQPYGDRGYHLKKV